MVRKIEKIRAEIKQRYKALDAQYAKTKSSYVEGMMDALDHIETFIDSLQDENYDANKSAISSIKKMCDSYERVGVFTDKRAVDFLNNVRVKCKDAQEYDSLQDEPKDHSLPHGPWEKGYQPSGIACGTVCKEDNRLWIELNKDALPDYNDCAPIDFIPVKNDESKVVEFDHFEEDLKEAAMDAWALYEYREHPKGLYHTCFVDGFKIGADWQKEQDKEVIELAEDHAMFAGRVQMKKELIKDAVEGEVVKDMHGFFHIKSVPIDGAKYKFGNRYKIIILKDDETQVSAESLGK